MNPDEQAPSDPAAPQPVVYDQNGNPLYAHPPVQQPESSHQVVQMVRPIEPAQPHLSEKAKQRHEESKKNYPLLNLSEGEYVISAIQRHPVGLISIWGVAGAGILIAFLFIPFVISNMADASGTPMLALMMLMLAALFFLGGVIATVVYNANRFFLTNESVTQHIQTSLFSKKEQTISLANIEDASFKQSGIVQHLIGYGSLRLSTEGDETTYRFNYVSNPQRQVTLLNDAVEAFKNGRPVGLDGDD